MTAEILSIGTELLMGQITNTDAQYIAQRLSEAGVALYRLVTVGDNPARIRDAIRTALSRCDLLITTGGLGPTADDITKETVAEALSVPMVRFPEAEAHVRSWFEKNNRPMTENNLRQADFAEGSLLLRNDFGTAPGCILEHGDKVVVHLPGPPRELFPMVDTGLMPYLFARGNAKIVSRYLRIYGMGESAAEARIRDIMESSENPTVAPYCSTGECQLRLTVRCAPEEDAESLLDPMEKTMRERLGNVIYGVSKNPDAHVSDFVVDALQKTGKTLACAESCTGGMIADWLVGVPGASDVFGEGHITYSNEAKMRVLGVKKETLNKYTAVSAQTALEMAQGLRDRSGADYAVSVTGIAGPGGGTEDKPVGLVYIGLSTASGTETHEYRFTGDREKIRTLATLSALHLVLDAVRNA